MIEEDFDFGNIVSVNFAVALRSTGERFFVPTDTSAKDALKDVLRATNHVFHQIEGHWEVYDISEDYGSVRRVYARRDLDYLADVSSIFDADSLTDLANVHEHAEDIDYYFGTFFDSAGRKIVGIRKATQLKGMLGARNRLMRLVDDTLTLINDEVLRLDENFDILVTHAHVFILKTRAVEYVANIVERVARTAATKIQLIHDEVTFLDMSKVKDHISKHPKMARLAASIAARGDLAQFQRDQIKELAESHGIKFREVAGRLRCRRQDEAKLLEILDARRYRLSLTAAGAVPYRATARQKVTV